MPCSTVENPNDFDFFIDHGEQGEANSPGATIPGDSDQVSTSTLAAEGTAQSAISEDPVIAAVQKLVNNPTPGPDVVMTSEDDVAQTQDVATGDGEDAASSKKDIQLDDAEAMGGDQAIGTDGSKNKLPIGIPDNERAGSFDLQVPADSQEESAAPHRMRTRAQAQAASDNNTASSHTRSASPESEELHVHPYFLAPRSSFADRDFGLPKDNAEEIRRLLQLYIQKQEKVCRGAQKVYDGLMKADQLRKLVLKWCKAEGHVGINRDMSDGEDWYDKEEWGLDADLKKGQDEEEEDAATTAKKTRTRRQ